MKVDIWDVWSYLTRYSSFDSPVKSAALERAFRCKGGSIRDAIEELRRGGKPIGSDQRGYYYAATKEELEPTLAHLERRAMSMLATIKQLRAIYAAESQLSIFN